ncbi:DUF7333 family protein [Halohasta litorea]|uniref:Uncharacterized protein n=1 Tax=Halohasta litorea TaxID=869891 RepID=A0ABD6D6C6_9EURY|nr:hypothetical protein [Halohasta litorea]
MEFDRTTTIGLFVAVIAIGTIALVAAPMMQASTVLMMVLPSMVVFGLITFGIGLKHGQYQAGR